MELGGGLAAKRRGGGGETTRGAQWSRRPSARRTDRQAERTGRGGVERRGRAQPDEREVLAVGQVLVVPGRAVVVRVVLGRERRRGGAREAPRPHAAREQGDQERDQDKDEARRGRSRRWSRSCLLRQRVQPVGTMSGTS